MERSPFKDLTNTTTEGNVAPHLQQKKATSQVWYARTSDEKKAEFLQKHCLDRQEKKAAIVKSVGTDQVAQTPASSSSSVSADLQPDKKLVGQGKQTSQGWYAELSNEKAEYLK